MSAFGRLLAGRRRVALLGLLVVLASWTIAGMQLAAGVLAAAFLLAGDFRELQALRLPVLAFAGWCLLSVLLSPAQLGTFLPTAWLPVLLVWVVAAFGRDLDEASLERVGGWWVGATAVSSTWAIIQAYTGIDLLHLLHLRAVPVEVELGDWPGHHAATGFFVSRLTYAHALLVPLGISSALAIRRRGTARLLATAASVVMLAGLLLSFARAAWWGALALGALLILTTRARRAALIGGLLALGVAGSVPSVRTRFLSGTSLASNSDRLFIWDRAREVIADYPILGVGFGAYPQVSAPYYDRANVTFPMRTWCHDTPLSLLAETGPLGVLLYLALWVMVYGLGWRAARRGSALALGLIGGTLALHVASLFHDILYNAEVAYALYVGGGLLAALGLRERDDDRGWLGALQALGRELLLGLLRLAYPLPNAPAPAIDSASLRRVLVVRIDTRVGNVLLTTPLIRALRKGLPQTHVDVLVSARNVALIEGLAHRVIPFEKQDFFQAPGRFWASLRSLQREHYDLIVEAGHWHAFSFTSLWLTHFIGAPLRVGHARGEAARFLTHPVIKDHRITREVAAKLELLAPLGVRDDGEHLETTVDRGETSPPFTWPSERRLVSLNPGARKPDHRWSSDAFGILAARLHDELGLAPVILWGPGEKELADAVHSRSGGKATLAPPTNLKQLAASFRRSALVITNDTGPMHLAVATGVPVLAVLLAEDGARWSHAERFTGVEVRGSGGEEVARVFDAAAALLAPPKETP